jgi:hypothetical protein
MIKSENDFEAKILHLVNYLKTSFVLVLAPTSHKSSEQNRFNGVGKIVVSLQYYKKVCFIDLGKLN